MGRDEAYDAAKKFRDMLQEVGLISTKVIEAGAINVAGQKLDLPGENLHPSPSSPVNH
jgi:hypothetical protein